MKTNDPYLSIMTQLGYPESQRFRAICEYMLTNEQAEMVACLPSSIEGVSKKTGISIDKVKTDLDYLSYKGVVFPDGEFEKSENFSFPESVLQFLEATAADQRLDVQKDNAFFKLWYDFSMEEWYPDRAKEMAAREEPHRRVIPAYQSIKDNPDILPEEDFREMLKAQSLIAGLPCGCRRMMTSAGDPCDYAKEEYPHCLHFGPMAEYLIKRGAAKELSIDEALKVVDKIEEDGLLHMWGNSSDMFDGHGSCQCCRDCCLVYVPLDMANLPIGTFWEKSRYQAEVNQNNCIGCQDCIDRCQFDAIEMVQTQKKGNKKGNGKYKANIIPDNCWGCGVCVVACENNGALSMKTVRSPEHIPVPA